MPVRFEKHILAKYGAPVPEALVESALYHVSLLERFDFDDIVISIKSSNVQTMIAAYRLLAEKCEYPLHLGVTEAGTARMGVIKNAIGIGSLLVDGIGDTIRVSLTADPVEEVKAGYDILKAADIRKTGAGDYFLSDLRQDAYQFDCACERGGSGACRLPQACKGRRHGLCGKWPG